jgi:hypothetical protein
VIVTVTATVAEEKPASLSVIVAEPAPTAVTTKVPAVDPGTTVATAVFEDVAATPEVLETEIVCV